MLPEETETVYASITLEIAPVAIHCTNRIWRVLIVEFKVTHIEDEYISIRFLRFVDVCINIIVTDPSKIYIS